MPPPPELAKYIDDLMRADLLIWRDIWFWWLIVSTAIVVVGLICEGPELAHEISSMQRRYEISKFKVTLNQPHAPDWVKVLAFFGWLLIVGGVAGELFTTVFFSHADAYIQEFNDISLAETNRAAGNAKASAEIADWAASRARDESDKATASASNALVLAKGARSEAESLEQDIVSAKKQAAELEARLAGALAEIERVDADRSELEASLTPRRLPLIFGPRGSNIDPLLAFSGKLGIFIEYIPDDAEAKRAAGEIGKVLSQAKWQILSFGPSERVVSEGVKVDQYHPKMPASDEQFRETGEDGKILDALVDFLQSYGWVASRGYAAAAFEGETIPPHTARVRVGIKPTPYFDPQWVKDSQKRIQQMREQMKKYEQQIPPR